MHTSRALYSLFVTFGGVAFFAGCGMVNGPEQKEPCGVGASYACSEQTAVGEKTIHSSWDPASRRLARITYQGDTLVPGQSYVHYYNASLKDSVVYWVEAIEDTDTSWGGFGRYTYDRSGMLASIVQHNAEGVAFRTVRYDRAGNVIADSSTTACLPGAAQACADTIDSLSVWGDTLEVIRRWNPDKREYLELTLNGEWVIQDASFLHVYDSKFRDSIVYWIESVDAKGLSFSGWGEYEYDSAGNLMYIGNYNWFDGELYGYLRYDSEGDKIAEMADGFVQIYENGRVVKDYIERSEDTTLYVYNDTGGLVEERYKEGDRLIQQRVYSEFDNGGVVLSKEYDSAETLRKETYRDTWYRIVEAVYYSPDGAVEHVTTRTYWEDGKYSLKLAQTLDSEGNHVQTLYFNENGLATERLIADGVKEACMTPYSSFQCITAVDTSKLY